MSNRKNSYEKKYYRAKKKKNKPNEDVKDVKNELIEKNIVFNNKEVKVNNSCILANRHIHCKTSELDKYGLKNGQVLKVRVNGERGGIMDNVIVKSKESYNFEMHIDTDEANAFMLSNSSVVEIMEEK